MTAVDGDPLTGDPTGPDVRHLLRIIPARTPGLFLHVTTAEASGPRAIVVGPAPERRPDRIALATPVIHEACELGQCGGCTSKTCRTRRPGPVPVELAPAPWYDGDHIDGSNS